MNKIVRGLLVVGSIEMMSGCAGAGGAFWDEERAQGAVEANGYTDVDITDKDINAIEVELHCGSDSGYTVSFDFIGKVASGEAVKGHLCANALGRSSIRGVELVNG